MLHNNTHLRLKKAVETLDCLRTGRDHSVNYEEIDSLAYLDRSLSSIIKESVDMIPKALQLLDEGKYSKKVFPCCYYLKERPFIWWSRGVTHIDQVKGMSAWETHKKFPIGHGNDVFVLSIKQGDSRERGLWLSKLRQRNTFFWFNKKKQLNYFYPLRDTKNEVVDRFLQRDPDFRFTQSSGCVRCPVVMMFE